MIEKESDLSSVAFNKAKRNIKNIVSKFKHKIFVHILIKKEKQMV